MLNQLSISQFAIIDKTEINFSEGFTVLSGETGAGKSILIDAISLLIGARSDSSMIRYGSEKADISAHFSQAPKALQDELSEQELQDDDEPSQALFRRTIRGKGSKAFINSQATTTSNLKKLAPYLINIHGQHANQALLDPAEQRDRLDRFANHPKLLASVKDSFEKWQQLQQQYAQIKSNQNHQQERRELLDYQLDTFDQVQPKQGEFSELSAQQTQLSAAEEILQDGNTLTDLLKNKEPSISENLYQAKKITEQRSEHKIFSETNELLAQASIYIDEAYDNLATYLSHVEIDPAQLSAVDERMNSLHRLAKKYLVDPDELESHYRDLKAEREAIDNADNNLQLLSEKLEKAEDCYIKAADKLSKSRKKFAAILAKEIEVWIRQLGMSKAQFEIKVNEQQNNSWHGRDQIQYYLCANPGQNLQLLSKVASGGELSRISLAIEVALLEESAVPHTLIFDEIDAGIGGEVAYTVGKLLSKLSKKRQVLCITHLPQVAAWANHHFHIQKSSSETTTQTKVIALSKEKRIIEIARMLGDAKAKTSREHALAMLDQCQTNNELS